MDAIAILWTGMPFILSKAEAKRIPFVGKMLQFAQTIFVCRSFFLRTFLSVG
jgi:hypothetical protein